MSPSPLQRALLDWYEGAKRDLPWRRTRDPYLVWLSEVMLQQTRVEVVVDYWERFRARFPTLADLAAADEDEVLAMWSGLGYYRRARGLLSTARVVAAEHGGRLPADAEALRALPGFGPYTVGAVGSIALDLELPVVDGNVARVLARLFEVEGFVDTGPVQRTLWRLAERELHRPDAGTWNQALMELGATVCKPKNPACEACPVADLCAARARGRQLELPRKRPRPKPHTVVVEALVLRVPGGLLLARRPPGGRNPGLFEVPIRERTRPARGLWPADWEPAALGALFDSAPALDGAERLRHSITRHRITVDARTATLSAAGAAQITDASPWALVPDCALAEVALSGLAAKLLRSASPPE